MAFLQREFRYFTPLAIPYWLFSWPLTVTSIDTNAQGQKVNDMQAFERG